MLMVNVNTDATEREIVLLFKSCGTVEKVDFDSDETDEDANSDHDLDSDSVSAENNSETNASSPSQPRAQK